MHDLTVISSLIEAETGYSTYLMREKEFTLVNPLHLPLIYIGPFMLDSSAGGSVITNSNIFTEHGENLIETFEIHIQDTPENLYKSWRNVAKSINGVNPYDHNEQNSIIFYKEGHIQGYEQGQIRWLDYWNLSFPSLNPYI